LENLLSAAGISYKDISLYAVGRGPGSFSGMRMSFAIAQALALPNKTEVRAVSSGAALALAAARDGAKEICVAGDARRGQFWTGFFSATANEREWPRINQTEDWKLIPYEELIVPEGTLLVSPEAERLAEFFAAPDGRCPATAGPLSLRSGPDIGNARFPLASDVARLARTQSEPLEPLYMHPPVFIEPKYS
jgi:tRNA threonylcarbamoyl adenosine modification protein YeaZ